jgi:hypothetical protein
MCLFKNFDLSTSLENRKQLLKPKKLKAMKTIKKIKFAFVAILLCFATVANAQTLVSVTGTNWPTLKTTPAGWPALSTNDPAQADFVTVGAVMPYRTVSGGEDFKTWKTMVETYFFPTGTAGPAAVANVLMNTTWTVAGGDGVNNIPETELASGLGLDSVLVRWSHIGNYLISAKTTMTINGTEVTGCDNMENVKEKQIYVLPAPQARRAEKLIHAPGDPTDGRNFQNVIFPCTTKSLNLPFQVRGIGEVHLFYTVTRRPIGSPATEDNEEGLSEGMSRNTPSWFNHSPSGFAEARDLYLVGMNSSPEVFIPVTGLLPGYLYEVKITEISDQISRKSEVELKAPNFWSTSNLTENLTYRFAIVPTPMNTNIEHIRNINHD